MKIQKHTVQACCGKTSIIFKLDQPLMSNHLESLKKFGYKEWENFTKAGILYADNLDFILTGPIGSNQLQVKCKHKSAICNEKMNDLEVLLAQIG